MLQSMGSQELDRTEQQQRASLVTALFTESNVFKVHLCFCTLALPFYCQMIFHSLYGFTTLSSHQLMELDCFHLETFIKNRHLYVNFGRTFVFISLGSVPRCGTAGSYANFTFNFFE